MPGASLAVLLYDYGRSPPMCVLDSRSNPVLALTFNQEVRATVTELTNILKGCSRFCTFGDVAMGGTRRYIP